MTSKALSLAMIALLSAHIMAAPMAQAGALGTFNQIAGPVVPLVNGSVDEEDHSLREAGKAGIVSAGTVGVATTHAIIAGAGPLASYAGTASAVSSLGLGGVTTAVAGAMGSSATGAAATSLVVGAVGGPVIFAGILIGGTAIATYGLYKAGQSAMKSLR